MPIRRKSTQQREPKPCSYHEQMQHERVNQDHHETRQRVDEQHDPTPCWCCCEDCTELSWFYPTRKGVWWVRNESGDLRMERGSSVSSDPTKSSWSTPTSSADSGAT